ncbi:MAG TPA: hypothetical protein PLT45_00685 [Smithella sp.]|nr:hypothetical protein [Smithella sp.]
MLFFHIGDNGQFADFQRENAFNRIATHSDKHGFKKRNLLSHRMGDFLVSCRGKEQMRQQRKQNGGHHVLDVGLAQSKQHFGYLDPGNNHDKKDDRQQPGQGELTHPPAARNICEI